MQEGEIKVGLRCCFPLQSYHKQEKNLAKSDYG